MSEANALVERMGVAVRTAYKAIEVLKVENQSLKLENEALRKQILLLGGSVSTALSDDPANELQATDSRYNNSLNVILDVQSVIIDLLMSLSQDQRW